jgi:hypothetical protein
VVVHVDVECAVGVDVRPDQGVERLLVAVVQPFRPGWFGEDLLDDEGVDEHERCLEEVHREHRDLLVFAVLAGQLGVFAVEDELEAAVPVLDDLSAFVDLPADGFVGEVVAEEDRAGCASELFHRLVRGVLRASAREPAEQLLGFGGAELQRGGVLDELVVDASRGWRIAA